MGGATEWVKNVVRSGGEAVSRCQRWKEEDGMQQVRMVC